MSRLPRQCRHVHKFPRPDNVFLHSDVFSTRKNTQNLKILFKVVFSHSDGEEICMASKKSKLAVDGDDSSS